MSAEPPSRIVIQAGASERHYWADLWRYRELLFTLAQRDVRVRYKQTVIGVAWAVIRPLGIMLVFTLIFGRIAKLPSEGAPYTLLVFTGMLPWLFFASAVSESSNSLVANSNLLTKIYFPRLLIPLSSVAASLVDLIVGFVLLLGLMVLLGYPITLRWLALPLLIALAATCALGLGFWFAALNVKYRDFQFVVPVLLLMGLYISPIGFASSVIPEDWRTLYVVNPMVGVIEGFRWALLGGQFRLRADALAFSAAVTSVLMLTGVVFFRRIERSIADVI